MAPSVYAVVDKKKEALLETLKKLPYVKNHGEPFTEIPFGEIFEVWAEWACGQTKSSLLAAPALERAKLDLIQALSFHCAPTFAALLQVAKLDKMLEGESPKERYLFYVEHIFPNPFYLSALFSHFPPLAHKIASLLLLWIDQMNEFLGRLERDHAELQRVFSVQGRVERISSSLSDLHNGNRTVYKLSFERGPSLIYKPKSIALDAAFQEFLEELKPFGIDLLTYRILNCGEYGWAEFLESEACPSLKEATVFFERLGMLICLMYVLEGTDCHFENMLACGNQPVLIDLESLFHPLIAKQGIAPEMRVWARTVFRTGFLPRGGFYQGKIDRSPLSAEEEQQTEQLFAQWQDTNTDQMRFVFVKKTARLSIPRPKIAGKIVSTAPYIPQLLSGFEKMYRCFQTHQELLAERLQPLFCNPVRFILRPTEFYTKILYRLTDPKLMNSTSETARTLDVLNQLSTVEDSFQLHKIVESEKEALLHGDIPFFQSLPSDTNLYYGRECIAKGLFDSPVQDKVVASLHSLSEKDLIHQKEYIEYSLYFLQLANETKTLSFTPYQPKDTAFSYSESERLAFAEQIGHQIVSLGQTLPDGAVSWLTLEPDPANSRYYFQPLSPFLYAGLSGVALFFASLGSLLKKEFFSRHAELILEALRRPYFQDSQTALLLSNIGGMSGLGGQIYVFSTIGHLLKKPRYLEDALKIASLVNKEKIQQSFNDLLTGCAGWILALLALYARTNESSLLRQAEIAGDHLLKVAKQVGKGLAWTFHDLHLCGVSHGASGISYALMKLFALTKEERFLRAAEQGIAFERGLYSSEMENWPDLRKGVNKYGMRSWCHGAPGIGLARLYALKICPDEEKEKELEAALLSTQKYLYEPLDHLCCGNFGRISFFSDAGKLLQRKELKEVAHHASAALLKRYSEKGVFRLYRYLSERVQNPSFMQGLAGIGYEILRETRQGEGLLPQVLLLD